VSAADSPAVQMSAGPAADSPAVQMSAGPVVIEIGLALFTRIGYSGNYLP
jgi:hypothetical protein